MTGEAEQDLIRRLKEAGVMYKSNFPIDSPGVFFSLKPIFQDPKLIGEIAEAMLGCLHPDITCLAAADDVSKVVAAKMVDISLSNRRLEFSPFAIYHTRPSHISFFEYRPYQDEVVALIGDVYTQALSVLPQRDLLIESTQAQFGGYYVVIDNTRTPHPDLEVNGLFKANQLLD